MDRRTVLQTALGLLAGMLGVRATAQKTAKDARIVRIVYTDDADDLQFVCLENFKLPAMDDIPAQVLKGWPTTKCILLLRKGASDGKDAAIHEWMIRHTKVAHEDGITLRESAWWERSLDLHAGKSCTTPWRKATFTGGEPIRRCFCINYGSYNALPAGQLGNLLVKHGWRDKGDVFELTIPSPDKMPPGTFYVQQMPKLT